MNIEYIDVIFSACFTLRKLKTILLKENKDYYMRPQLHILFVAPFGNTKSSITKSLKMTYKEGKDIWTIDDFTKASVEGSISKDGDYIQPIVMNIGGQIMIIDEWNNVDQYGQQALLGVLENQQWKRSLGFKVKHPYTFNEPNGYGGVKIFENIIEGNMRFGCIALAMEYPIYENSQKAKALLSRFSPFFLEPTQDFIKATTKGEFDIKIQDYSGKVENVIIPKNVYMRFHKEYYKFIDDNSLFPEDSDDYGFISRIMSDVIRLGVYNYLRKTKMNKNTVKIESTTYFTEMFPYIRTLHQQFLNPKTKGKLQQYRDLVDKYPGESKEFYAKSLGVTRQTIWEYDKKVGGNIKKGILEDLDNEK